MNNKIFILCMVFISGMAVDELITIRTCDNNGAFVTIFNSDYSCEKIEKDK